METKKSMDNKARFLLFFTRELIKNSSEDYIFILQHSLKKKEFHKQRERTKKIGLKLQERSIPEMQKLRNLSQNRPPYPQANAPKTERFLTIPEPKLPERLQYLQPVPIPQQIDLGELNPLIQNPSITTIECNGPGKKIRVIASGIQTTEIALTREEIDEVINRFSKATKIPVTEGIYRVIYGNLKLTAIISKVTGSKFIIKKIAPQRNLNLNRPMPARIPRNPPMRYPQGRPFR